MWHRRHPDGTLVLSIHAQPGAKRTEVERFVDVTALRRWYASSQSHVANTETYLGLFRVVALEMWMRAFGVN